MLPLLLLSRTEKDSRRLWRSWGGSLERESCCDRPVETRRRGSRFGLVVLVRGVLEIESESVVLNLEGETVVVVGSRRAVGDGGGSVCALLVREGSKAAEGLEGVEMVSSSSSSSETV